MTINGLNIPQPATKTPKFATLQEAQGWWEIQRNQVSLEIKYLGPQIQNATGNQTLQKSLLEKKNSLRKTFTEIESKIIQIRGEIKAQKSEAERNRENDPIPLIVDLIGIGIQILDELREINRKLPERETE